MNLKNYSETLGSSKVVYIASVDVGSTNMICQIYNKSLDVLGNCVVPISKHLPSPGRYELDPHEVWKSFQYVVKMALEDAHITSADLTCIGISTIRNSFLLWDRVSSEPLTPMISWQDLRASKLCDQLNQSITMKCIHYVSKIAYFLTRIVALLVTSAIYFTTDQMAIPLLYEFQNNPKLVQAANNETLCVGNVDSWLLWKLTGGKVFATDYGCISTSVLYDIFMLKYSSIMFKYLGLPSNNYMPEVRNTSGDFGLSDEEIFGHKVPIQCIIGDQQAATAAECCLQPGQAKLTLGTGSFININTGMKAYASVRGMYPVIGWKIGDQVTYLIEGNHSDTGTTIEWLRNLGFFSDFSEITDMVDKITTSDLYFIPAFNGLKVPVIDSSAAGLFIGITSKTSKEEMVFAVMDSIVMMAKQLVETVLEETGYVIPLLYINGNVARNDWLVQRLANHLQIPVSRGYHDEASCLGAAMMAGLAAKVWQDEDELQGSRKAHQIFEPEPMSLKTLEHRYSTWRRAVDRSRKWYNLE